VLTRARYAYIYAILLWLIRTVFTLRHRAMDALSVEAVTFG
jgi:hypothetical protein